MAHELDIHTLLEAFLIYIESDGNIAEVNRQTNHSITTLRKYSEKLNWESHLERVRQIMHEHVKAACAVTIEESITNAVAIRAAVHKKLLTKSGNLSKKASGSLMQRYKELDRYVLELKGKLPGSANPETIPEQKMRQAADRFLAVFIKIIERIPGAEDFIRNNADELQEQIDAVVEDLI